MDKRYALVLNGKIHEVIDVPEGSPKIQDRYHPSFIANMVDITMLIPQPQLGWLMFSATDGRFYEALGTDMTPPVEPLVAGNTESPITDNTDPRALFATALVN